MFPDSQIAKKFQCTRTKAYHVIEELAQHKFHGTLNKMKGSFYSIATDDSTDIDDAKLYPLVVKTFDEKEGKVVCELLDIKECKESSTGVYLL